MPSTETAPARKTVKRAANVGGPHDGIEDLHREVAEICARASKGDLEARILNVEHDTEFGKCCLAINHLLDIADAYVRESAAAMSACAHGEFHRPILLRGMPGAYRKSAVVINRAAAKMKESVEQNRVFEEERVRVANKVSQSADSVAGSAQQVDEIAAAICADSEKTDQMSASVARLAQGTAANMSSVSAACEELSATTSEIARQCRDSESLTSSAVSETDGANETVRQLAEAAQKIQSVVNLIQKIAAQTNLLALNATIEAARAGQHGAGFAVVATEVKELARSTAGATDEISGQVENIQLVAETVAKSIAGIAASIQNVNSNAASIAKSIEEQVQAASEIAGNVADATRSSNEISETIEGVSAAASATREAADGLKEASSLLIDESVTLGDEVAGLKGKGAGS